jgi:hypothetical protein
MPLRSVTPWLLRRACSLKLSDGSIKTIRIGDSRDSVSEVYKRMRWLHETTVQIRRRNENPTAIGFSCILRRGGSDFTRPNKEDQRCRRQRSHRRAATICGTVVSANYSSRSKGQPTFLNLDEPYPKQVFTILIWGSDRPKFGEPESKYRDQKICVTGKITSYRGVAEIAATDPGQLEIQRK